MKPFSWLLPVFLTATACVAPPPGTESPTLQYLRGVGQGLMLVEGNAALQKYAPEAIPFLDINPQDGIVTVKELEAIFYSTNPDHIAWLTVLTYHLIRARS